MNKPYFVNHLQILENEDDLKILRVDYLSNHLLDPTPILKLRLDYQK
jgi:hypothetical protein